MEAKILKMKLTPRQVAEGIYNLDSIEQAEMFENLHDYYDGDHFLMMQFLYARDNCMERGGIYGKAMSAYQSMFAAAYKYMWDK